MQIRIDSMHLLYFQYAHSKVIAHSAEWSIHPCLQRSKITAMSHVSPGQHSCMCLLIQSACSNAALVHQVMCHVRLLCNARQTCYCLYECCDHGLQKEARDAAFKKPPAWMGRSWNVAFAICIFIAVIVFIFGFGFGAWASILSFKQNSSQYGAFAACYQCTTPAKTPATPTVSG